VVLVYTAEHPALAALEILNAWQSYRNLNGYHLYLCRLDQHAVTDAVPALTGQGTDLNDAEGTRAFGDEWVLSRRSVALRVPSAVAPASYNYLLNPDHPDFESAVERELLGLFQFDERITALVKAAKVAATAKKPRTT